MRRTSVALVSLSLLVGACGAAEVAETTTTTVPQTTTTLAPTTTVADTTTTTEDTRPRSLLDGLPVDDAELLDRRVIAIKIDNHPNARPQSGIQEADAVAELRVEGGLTRFMALFHESDSSYVGPIRSGRPSDAKFFRPLAGVLFISGAQPWVQRGINAADVPFFVEPPSMFRISGRRAPHNLYGKTEDLRLFADERELPDEAPATGLWEFGELPAAAEMAAETTVRFSRETAITWTWSGTEWERTLNGGPSEWRAEDDTTETITADTLVMIVGRFFTDRPSSGSGSAVPSTDTIGEGDLWVFGAGTVVQGRWARENAEDPFTFTTVDGDPLSVPPGRPWISIVPDIGEVTWQ